MAFSPFRPSSPMAHVGPSPPGAGLSTRRSPPSRNPPGPNRHAHFSSGKDDYREERSKILTMRYGKQQMMLIRKRLRVEMWLMESLEELFSTDQGPVADPEADVDIDIDQLLDMPGEAERRRFLREKLAECKASSVAVETFIAEFLDRLRSL